MGLAEKSSKTIGKANTAQPHPDTSRGIFMPDGSKINIEAITSEPPKTIEEGTIYSQKIHLSNGSWYRVLSGEPRKRSTDIPTIATTPWLTGLGGLNQRMFRAIMRLGGPVDLVGADQQWAGWRNLEKTAHNQLVISEATSEKFERDSYYLNVYGISRAAMLGFGMNTLASSHDKEVIHSDLIVPCFARKPNPLRILTDYIDAPWNEVSSLRSLGSLPLSTLYHYPKSFDFSFRGINAHAKVVPTLLSGVSGDFAERMPPETRATVTVFDGDKMSQGTTWARILAQYKGIYLRRIHHGAHLSCASPRTYNEWLERQKRLFDELKRTGSVIKDVDWAQVSLGRAAVSYS